MLHQDSIYFSQHALLYPLGVVIMSTGNILLMCNIMAISCALLFLFHVRPSISSWDPTSKTSLVHHLLTRRPINVSPRREGIDTQNLDIIETGLVFYSDVTML